MKPQFLTASRCMIITPIRLTDMEMTIPWILKIFAYFGRIEVFIMWRQPMEVKNNEGKNAGEKESSTGKTSKKICVV